MRRLRDARRPARSIRAKIATFLNGANVSAFRLCIWRGRLRLVRDSEADAQKELARITDVKQNAAGYDNYQQWLAGTQLEQRVSLEDYSVSNRGLRSGLIGTPEQVRERIAEFEMPAPICFSYSCSPQLEEMERFGAQVIQPASRPVLRVINGFASRETRKAANG